MNVRHPAIGRKNQVQTGQKIKFIKLDISNWNFAKIKSRQIGGKACANMNGNTYVSHALILTVIAFKYVYK